VTTKDDRTDIFGIPYEPPKREEAVAQYQRRSMHKLHFAEWHGAEFERLQGECRPSHLRARGAWCRASENRRSAATQVRASARCVARLGLHAGPYASSPPIASKALWRRRVP
jgi:hypothetical protein